MTRSHATQKTGVIAPAAVKSLTLTRSPLLQRKCACGEKPGAKGECEKCRDERLNLQRRAAGPSSPAGVPPVVREVLQSPGRPLPSGARSHMESRFGHDFSQVRVHTDARAAESARAVNSLAYTVGRDVVFGSGQYAPHTTSGQRLLAHELAHTIQQQGMQRYSNEIGLGESAHYAQLEREADAAADAAMSAAPTVAPASAHIVQRAPAPLISRLEAPASVTPPVTVTPPASISPGAAPEGPARDWQPFSQNIGEGQRATERAVLGVNIVAFKIDKFILPPQKGPVLSAYERKAAEGSLEATIDFSGTQPQAGLWQQREVSGNLRENWYLKVGWTAAQAAQKWHEHGGPPPGQNGLPANKPRVPVSTCDADHIIELQLGGVNVPENLQMLNSTENTDSGRLIWQQVSGLARELMETIPGTKPSQILLHFDSAVGGAAPPTQACAAPGAATSCTQVEACAMSRRSTAPATPQGAEPTETQTIEAGSTPAVVHLRPAPAPTNLLETGAHNLAASELVPGMILRVVNRPGQPNVNDHVSACVETPAPTGATPPGAEPAQPCVKRTATRGTRVPITMRDQRNLEFDIVTANTGQRRLRLRGNPHPNVRFTYPYLSEGNLRLGYDEQNGIEGTGTLRPSIPLLSRAVVQVHLSRGELSGVVSIPPEQLRLPFPGARVTRAELGVELSPAFRPYGVFAFEVGPHGRPVVDGSLTAEADQGGFVARGVINAHLPGVDQAQGNVEYRNGRWRGSIEINSSQINLPMVQRAALHVDFNEQGIVPSGTVLLQLPGGQQAEMSVRRRGTAWVYAGRGTFDVPGIHPVEVAIEYDGVHLTGSARTGISLHGLTGDLQLRYRDGRLSGEGDLQLNRGRARGTVHARLSENLRFSGRGELQYQLTENLIGRVGVELFEDQRMRVTGALEFPQPVRLFPPYASEREFFRRSVDIPIVGVSIGSISIGLIGRITGAFGARYGIGPGELRNLRVMTAFNPLDENPDVEIQAGARLVIPAYAGLSLSIRGAVGLSAGIASVTGGITATGVAELRGGLDAAVEIAWRRGRFSLDAQAAIRVSPVLRLLLDADVTAEAGAFGLTISWTRVWHLAAYEWGSGLQFGLVAPIHYATGEAFRAPSLSDIQWIIPDLSVNNLVPQLIGRAASSEREN